MEKSEVEKIISLARDEYTVHECRECTYRKCCDLNSNGFGSAECLSRRVSISLMLGIEDGKFTKILDDIEAAWRRENVEIEANALAVGGLVGAERQRVVVSKTETTTVGNSSAMREALKDYHFWIWRYFEPGNDDSDIAKIAGRLKMCKDAATAALSAPPRNCDVGTAEEQAERFYNFCEGHTSAINGMCDPGCPCIGSGDKCHCMCKWAQTPYAEEERRVLGELAL